MSIEEQAPAMTWKERILGNYDYAWLCKVRCAATTRESNVAGDVLAPDVVPVPCFCELLLLDFRSGAARPFTLLFIESFNSSQTVHLCLRQGSATGRRARGSVWIKVSASWHRNVSRRHLGYGTL
jgi:hypothetical protein